MEKCHDLIKQNGFVAMITQQSFMFLSTFENLRIELINNYTIINMAHLGAHAFEEIGGEVVQATSFINRKNFIENYNSTFHRLTEFNSEKQKEEEFFNDKNKYLRKSFDFEKIPGKPIVYWISHNFIDNFDKGCSIGEISDFTGSQNKTANNQKYLRYFWEIDKNKLNSKWVIYAKGGKFKKYYGNLDIVVDWSEEARNFYKNNKTSNLLDKKYWYQKGITYNDIASSGTGFRYLPENCLFDMSGPSIVRLNHLLYCLGFLNSKIAFEYLKFLAPTIHIKVYNINSIPLIVDKRFYSKIEELTLENIYISKWDWDSEETSLDFKYHPLISCENHLIESSFVKLDKKRKFNFKKQKENQEKINELFIEIYNLKGLLKPEVTEKDITLNFSDYEYDIKSFISYAIGCMFGRYSLDNEELQFAGGNFYINNYSKFIPDNDNIIPVLDSEYFEDDIVSRFVEFVKVCFGEENLEENLDFIANALSKNKKPSREKIRDYLLKNFFNDHKKTYKKCPIYWQFSSGKENGFNCLVYMHRYEPSLVARIRTDYLHKTQKAIEQSIANCDNVINHSSSNTEITKATKDKNKLQKQLKETQEYDEALAHIANQNIEIDLDDGVKVNYAKFQNVEVSKEGKKSKKINLLKRL
ncbi:MAG: BREX-1 system adenine-specific DNA-methyltransferase PglX [Methanobrevibacter sp.]|nr:BREX-1 system adenine-specific DNA-methyltransferase PglX [Methanobrevibacter sp.]MBR3112549.1 BREX-1 system adenine-specific DNA-methyltransferase PglX [Methanobrevibacter sp.]